MGCTASTINWVGVAKLEVVHAKYHPEENLDMPTANLAECRLQGTWGWVTLISVV